jgi:hypothetical protein
LARAEPQLRAADVDVGRIVDEFLESFRAARR